MRLPVAIFAFAVAASTLPALASGTVPFFRPVSKGHAYAAKGAQRVQFMLQGSNAQAIADWSQAWRLDHTYPLVSYQISTPRAWGTLVTESFDSFAGLQQQIAHVAPGVEILLYDNEKWAMTPLNEQMDPQLYEQMFCAMAHDYGYACMTAPAPDLVSYQPPQTQWQAYLSQGYPQFSAQYGDFYEIQAQGYQSNYTVYQEFVQQAAAQALMQNPNVYVLAGLSTNPDPSQGVPTETTLTTDIANTRQSVAGGYWLNIPTPGKGCPKCAPPNIPLAEAVIQAENP